MTDLEERRYRIILMHDQGYGIREIARELDMSRNTVRTWIRRHGEEGILEDRRRYNHGVRLATDRQTLDKQRHYDEHTGTPPTRYFPTHYEVCQETIKNHLHNCTGLHIRQYAKKVALTDEQKRARLNFARDYLDFDWSNTIFTDEKSLKFSQQGRLTLRCYNDTPLKEDPKLPKQSSGRIIANMWAWMATGIVGEMVHIPPHANTLHYVDLLEETMLPTVRTVYPHEDLPNFFYVHDNSRMHTEKVVSNWFQQHLEITLIPWPSNSPDLNPVENLWALIAHMWDNRNERTKQAVELHCNQIWDYMRGSDICSRLLSSMRSRLLDVIESNGAYTRIKV